MSDGISDAYKSSCSREHFENTWNKAQAEHILLDFKAQFVNLSIEQLLIKLLNFGHVEFRSYDKFERDFGGQKIYTESQWYGPTAGLPTVRFFSVETSGRMHRRFEATSLKDAMKEATLFNEWILTEEGKRAVENYND